MPEKPTKETPTYISELQNMARQFDAALLARLGINEKPTEQKHDIGVTEDGYLYRLMVQQGMGGRIHYFYEESINIFTGNELPDFTGYNGQDRIIWESAEPCSYSWGIVYCSTVFNGEYVEMCVASEPAEIQKIIDRISS
jgi:hypothetical protein